LSKRDEGRQGRAGTGTRVGTRTELEISRREILKAMALAGTALPLGVFGCGSSPAGSACQSRAGPTADCSPYSALPPNPPPGDTVVAMVRRSEISRMTREAIDLAGGLGGDGGIAAGDKVLVKPNLVVPSQGDGAPVVTSREVLAAVIDAVKERTGAANIFVGDASADLPAPTMTEDVARGWGVLDLCEQKGVSFVSLKEQGYDPKSDPRWDALAGRQVPVSKFLVEVQHVINVPVLKNHEGVGWSSCNYSCCIKNLFGVTDSAWRVDGTYDNGLNAFHNERLADNLAELHLVLPPILMNVVDAVSVIVQGGPVGSAATRRVVHPGLVLAGKDLVATDSVALAVLKRHAKLECATFTNPAMDYSSVSVWHNPQIVRAAHLGLGRVNLDCAGLRQVTVEDGGSVDDLDEILAEWA